MQATLANLPLDAVGTAFPPGDPQRAQYEQWAEEALVTAVFCILLCASIGSLAIRYFAPLLLTRVRRLFFLLGRLRPLPAPASSCAGSLCPSAVLGNACAVKCCSRLAPVQVLLVHSNVLEAHRGRHAATC